MAQTLPMLLIVACSALYVLWAVVLPAAGRRRVARWLLRWRWPAPIAARLRALSEAGSGCGCNGCDAPARPAAGAAQPVHWAPRRKPGREG